MRDLRGKRRGRYEHRLEYLNHYCLGVTQARVVLQSTFVLSFGQLRTEIFRPVHIMVLLRGAFPYGSKVSLDNVRGRYYPEDTDLTQ